MVNAKDVIEVSQSSDLEGFERFENELRAVFKAVPVAVLDGLDETYHDLKIGDTVITFHSEYYLGTSIFLRHPASATDADLRVLEALRDYVFATAKTKEVATDAA